MLTFKKYLIKLDVFGLRFLQTIDYSLRLTDLYWIAISGALQKRKCKKVFALTEVYKGLSYPNNVDCNIFEKNLRIPKAKTYNYDLLTKLIEILATDVADATVIDSPVLSSAIFSNPKALGYVRSLGSGVCIFTCYISFSNSHFRRKNSSGCWKNNTLIELLHKSGFKQIEYLNIVGTPSTWKTEGGPVEYTHSKEKLSSLGSAARLVILVCDKGH